MIFNKMHQNSQILVHFCHFDEFFLTLWTNKNDRCIIKPQQAAADSKFGDDSL